MNVFSKVRFFNLFSVGLVLSLYVCIGLAFYYEKQLNTAHESKFLSMKLAQNLRDDSASLTRTARTFVVTGDAKYEQEYFDIIAVRSGEKSRPDGTKASSTDLMKAAGFTEQEFGFLEEAQKRSNALVKTETIAMNAAKGLFADADGKFTVKKDPDLIFAQKLMHDESYHKFIDTIGEPITQFETALEARTQQAVQDAIRMAQWSMGLVALMIIGLSFTMFMSSHTLKIGIRQQTEALAGAYSQIRGLVSNLSGSSSALSSASTESAASLEETVASLEELSSMIKLNADNAKSASDLSQLSKTTAEAGTREIEK